MIIKFLKKDFHLENSNQKKYIQLNKQRAQSSRKVESNKKTQNDKVVQI